MSHMPHNAGDLFVQRFITVFTAVTALFSAYSASALITDDKSLIEGAKQCTSYLPRHERQYGIPVHLLAAIASTESGRYNKELGMSLPWPWTINVEGKGYFYDTKEEAIEAVKELQARGFQSIDVGCMQVNLHHHPNAFANLEQAFDPAYNVAYGAQFLRKNFEQEGSWRKATADYHSHSLFFGESYANLVYGAWSRIINKVADARAGRPVLRSELAGAQPAVYSPSQTSAGTKYQRHTYHSLHMHNISVAAGTTKENGVLVIRPEHGGDVAEGPADPEDGFVSQNKKNRTSTAAAVASAANAEEHKARVIKVGSESSANEIRVRDINGQFEPSPHVVNSNAASTTNKSGSVFVFDN